MDSTGLTHWADILVIALYFVCVLGVGFWSVFSSSRVGVKGYFLAGRNMWWLPVGASLFASNIGSEHFIGLAGTGAASGIAIVLYEWLSLPLVLLQGWLFLPVYISAGVYTLPEYLEKRFGGKTLRLYLSCLSMVLYVITKIAVCMYAGALFIQSALGWNLYISVVVLLTVTAIYTVLGGLAAVIYTDTIQTGIMTVGAITLAIIGFNKIGGYQALYERYPLAIPEVRDENTTCGVPLADAFHLFRHPADQDNPWPGLVLQASLGCLWYWCCDQVIVQRTLAAKNLPHAKGGCLVAGYLKLLPLFLIVFPGMISRVLFKDIVGCANSTVCLAVCDNAVGCSNIAYPTLVIKLLPLGVRGLLMAAMMSAIVSSLTSIFNSASTLFTMDIWKRFRPDSEQWELLTVGRACIIILCVVSVLWVPLVQSSAGGQLFVYIQAIQGYLGSPVGAVFILAVFWPRTTQVGAIAGLVSGHLCGIVRLVLDFVFPVPECGAPDVRPPVARLHYTYFGQLVLLITFIVTVVVSLFTTPRTAEQLNKLTWWTKVKGCPIAVAPLNLQEAETIAVNKPEVNSKTESCEKGTKTESCEKGTKTESCEKGIKTESCKKGTGKEEAKEADSESGVAVDSETCLTHWWRYLFGIGQTAPDLDSGGDSSHLLYEPPKLRILLHANAAVALLVMLVLCVIYR